MWALVAQVLGCVILSSSFAYTRYVGFGFQSYAVYVAAEVLFVGWLFSYSYGKATSLFLPWFIGTGTMSVSWLILNYCIFRDPVSIKNMLGIGCVLIGAFLIAT